MEGESGVGVCHWGGVEAVGFGGCLYFYFMYGNPVEESKFCVGMVTLLTVQIAWMGGGGGVG